MAVRHGLEGILHDSFVVPGTETARKDGLACGSCTMPTCSEPMPGRWSAVSNRTILGTGRTHRDALQAALARPDCPLRQEIVTVAQKLAKEFGVEKGYRLLTNNGSEAGQTIYHLHFHLIGGKPLVHMA